MKKLILFILFLFIIDGVLSFFFKRMMKESQLAISESIMNSVEEVNVVICGTSHSLALQTPIFESAINIATYGESIQNTYFKLSHLINVNKTIPKKIILSYDLGLLKKRNIDNQSYQYHWNQYEDQVELIQFSDKKIDFTVNRISAFLFPFKDGEVDMFDYLFGKFAKKEALRGNSQVDSLKLSEVRSLSEECLTSMLSDFGLFYLKKIIFLCELNNINLILIRFPVTPNFYFQNSKCYDPEEYYKRVEELTFKNASFISILDFHDLYGNDKFRDPHHLKGGEIRYKFTKIVQSRINESQHLLKIHRVIVPN